MWRAIIIAVIIVSGFASVFLGDVHNPFFQSRRSEIPKEATATATLRDKGQTNVHVSFVIDGDTVEIDGGRRVRYIGINAPELSNKESPDECFASESAAVNRLLVQGRNVLLEKDKSDTDSYGRLLRYVFVDGVMVNDYLVRHGLARAAVYAPDTRYSSQFDSAQQEAKSDRRGLWLSCN